MTTAHLHELNHQEYQFDKLNMQVGIRLQLITHRHVKPTQYFSTLIGYVKDEYLIVKIPFEQDLPIGLLDGERVTVRVFSGINVCSFACSVQRVFGRPLYYVHLSFPTSIQGTSLRGAMRVRAEIPVKVTGLKEGASSMDCLLANISVTGARVDSPLPLPEGENVVALQFSLPGPVGNPDTEFSTRATVRNLAVGKPAASHSELYSYGVQFLDMDPVRTTMLQNMAYEALLADRGKIV